MKSFFVQFRQKSSRCWFWSDGGTVVTLLLVNPTASVREKRWAMALWNC